MILPWEKTTKRLRRNQNKKQQKFKCYKLFLLILYTVVETVPSTRVSVLISAKCQYYLLTSNSRILYITVSIV